MPILYLNRNNPECWTSDSDTEISEWDDDNYHILIGGAQLIIDHGQAFDLMNKIANQFDCKIDLNISE